MIRYFIINEYATHVLFSSLFQLLLCTNVITQWYRTLSFINLEWNLFGFMLCAHLIARNIQVEVSFFVFDRALLLCLVLCCFIFFFFVEILTVFMVARLYNEINTLNRRFGWRHIHQVLSFILSLTNRCSGINNDFSTRFFILNWFCGDFANFLFYF